VRSANLSKKPKPMIRREATFTSSGGDLRGGWGQRAGTVGLGRLGDPGHQFRPGRSKARAESIRRALGAGESERPIVARKRGNARGAKGPWQNDADSKRTGTDWSGANPTHYRQTSGSGERSCVRAPNPVRVNASCKEVLRKPDAGNPHVRFDEGRGGRRSLTFWSLIP
jgi:hypothetical protein